MAISYILTTTLQRGGTSVSKQVTKTASAETVLEETVAIGTDTKLTVAIDVSAVKAMMLVASTDTKIETNSSSAPDDTIELEAGVPYLYDRDNEAFAPFIFTADVTAFYVTNAAEAELLMYCLYDPTP